MWFNSLHFAAFFLVVLPTAIALARKVRARNVFLLIASYYFYGCWDYRFLGLILISSAVDYVCGQLLDPKPGTRHQGHWTITRRHLILIISLVVNLGILAAFKYFDFFLASTVDLLTSLGLEASVPSLKLVLPVGISFYTFQSLSYTIDVYRKQIPAERNPLNFALFVAFFPQLVAGPIERAARLLPQIRSEREVGWNRISSGMVLLAWGLFKKVVLADNLAPIADAAFGESAQGGAQVLLGTYAFALQIYCDFSGYSSIARGAARCMGFDIKRNFDRPYLATNPREFWQRWHISLSEWLRDYLYIPLGGNRANPSRTRVNLLTTMVLGGLWHGAGVTFLIWGLFHGALLLVYRAFAALRPAARDARPGLLARLWKALRWLLFFNLVCVGWTVFRAENLTEFFGLWARLFDPWQMSIADWAGLESLSACALTLMAYESLVSLRKDPEPILGLAIPLRAAVYAIGFLTFIWFGEFGGTPFVYFQF